MKNRARGKEGVGLQSGRRNRIRPRDTGWCARSGTETTPRPLSQLPAEIIPLDTSNTQGDKQHVARKVNLIRGNNKEGRKNSDRERERERLERRGGLRRMHRIL